MKYELHKLNLDCQLSVIDFIFTNSHFKNGILLKKHKNE